MLTKPLGVGIVTTAIKRGLASPALAKKAVALMSRLNTAGAEAAERKLVRAGVDVTGFGMLGHLASMCRASGVGAEITAGAIPAISREVYALIAQDCVPGGVARICSRQANASTGAALPSRSASCLPTRRRAADCCSASRRGGSTPS